MGITVRGILISEKEGFVLKRALAQKLYREGMTQKKISGLLGITQPMVSKYLDSPVRYSNAVEEVYHLIRENDSFSFSYLILSEPGSSGEYILLKRIAQDRKEIVQELASAVKVFKGKAMGHLLPKVKINICLSTATGKNRNDIASFPSGLVFVRGILATYLEPEFGVSGHLAGLLLSMKSELPEIRSMMNVRFSDQLLQKAAQKKMRFAFLNEDYALPKNQGVFDILIHKGSFGIEPAAYILGSDAYEVTRKCSELV